MKQLILCLLSLPLCAFRLPPVAKETQAVSAAVRQMYNAQFESSRESLAAYSALRPGDPLAYSLLAASYLFSELDRCGALTGNLFADNRLVTESESDRVDPQITAALSNAAAQAREHAQAVLARNPQDTNALLALCIVSGVQRDYLALVQHKMRESYQYIKESLGYSTEVLQVDPAAYDAYLTKGLTEYLVASLPFYLRWPMKLDNINGNKRQGVEDLRIAANSGHYLKPFAQLLLAMFYLREKQPVETEKLLVQLTREYPENHAFQEELQKLDGSQSLGN